MRFDVDHCLNCGEALVGPYCAGCGQERATRLTVRSKLAHAAASLWSLDRALLRTVVDLTLRPGDTCRGYVEGKRRRYVPPLTYAALCTALLVLVMTLRHAPPSAFAIATPFGPPESRDVAAELLRLVDRYAQPMLLLAPPVFATIAGLLHSRSDLNFAESTTFFLYVIGHAALLIAPVRAIVGVGGPAENVAIVGLSMAFYAWSARGFYRCGWGLATATVVMGYAAWLTVFCTAIVLSTVAATVLSR